jgi:flavin-dependent dehydrogenase
VVEQAAKAGGELREGFMVRDLIREDGCVAGFVGENSAGETEEIRARITVVADGRKSSFGNESGFVKRWPCHRFYYYRYLFFAGMKIPAFFVSVPAARD